MKKTIIILLLALSGSIMSQTVPIILTQRLPWAPASINVGGTCNIDVVIDTANYVAIITSGSFADADSMKFPAGKITMDEATKRLTIDNSISIKKGIQVHTSSPDVTIDASQYSSVVLRSASGVEAKLDHLVLKSDNFAIINVESPIEATEINIDAKSYSWIRYTEIEGKHKQTNVRGNARVVEIGKSSDRVEESNYGLLFQRDHQQLPLFMEYSFGSSTIGGLPFNSTYIEGNNYLWSINSISFFNYQFRYAFWSTNHWSLSTGIGVSSEIYRADNTYLDLVYDSLSSLYSIEAQNTSTLFAQEESLNGKIYWNSIISSICYLTIPIRLEWRNRADYRGIRIGAEIQPAIAIYKKDVTLLRNGFYADRNMVAATRNDKIGKIINPFRLDMRLSVANGRFGVFAQSSLTPIFRTKTDNPESKPALDKKLYSTSFGITFSF